MSSARGLGSEWFQRDASFAGDLDVTTADGNSARSRRRLAVTEGMPRKLAIGSSCVDLARRLAFDAEFFFEAFFAHRAMFAIRPCF